MSNPLHPVHVVGQVESYLLAHLPIVVLSTRNSRGRGPSTARALPAAPMRQPAIIDAETLQPVEMPAPFGRFIFASDPRVAADIIDVQATEVR